MSILPSSFTPSRRLRFPQPGGIQLHQVSGFTVDQAPLNSDRLQAAPALLKVWKKGRSAVPTAGMSGISAHPFAEAGVQWFNERKHFITEAGISPGW